MLIAFFISYLFLFFGDSLINLFNLELNDLRARGGIILSILQANMALGLTILKNLGNKKEKDANKALATIIVAPLISRPRMHYNNYNFCNGIWKINN